MNRFLLLLLLLAMPGYSSSLNAQVLLDAAGEGRAYDIINSVLAPGGEAVEPPDCSHPEFGDHIDMVYDADLGIHVFRFYIHKVPDNDRCIYFDRQRNEIKTYDKSPGNLLGAEGEVFEYKWKFRLDAGFRASSAFTHIHQLKAVGGPEESMPLVTLTPRKGNPDKMELRYAAYTTQVTVAEEDLEPFKGSWVEVEERVKYGESGEYSITIRKVEDGAVLLEYGSSPVRMWKTDAVFVRPKWGIYRSLDYMDDLRDEMVLFANFSIAESNPNGPGSTSPAENPILLYPNPAHDRLMIETRLESIDRLSFYDLLGRLVLEKNNLRSGDILNLSGLSKGIYIAGFRAGELSVEKMIIKR